MNFSALEDEDDPLGHRFTPDGSWSHPPEPVLEGTPESAVLSRELGDLVRKASTCFRPASERWSSCGTSKASRPRKRVTLSRCPSPINECCCTAAGRASERSWNLPWPRKRSENDEKTALLTCKEITELLTDYLEKRMRFSQRVRFQLHIGMCWACRRYLRQMRMAIAALGSLPPEPSSIEVMDSMMRRFQAWKGTGPPAAGDGIEAS